MRQSVTCFLFCSQSEDWFLCTPYFVLNGKSSFFTFPLAHSHALTMTQDVTNIHEEWDNFCQCQEFWCHFLKLHFWGKMALDCLETGAFSISKSPVKVFLWENEYDKWHQNSGSAKNLQLKRRIFVIVCGICRGVDKKQILKCQYRPKNHANVAQK